MRRRAMVLVGLVLTALMTSGAAAPRLRVLQMNLCNSGFAACYTGRSISYAASVIRAEAPDLVTLNEVCGTDMAVLANVLPAMIWTFQPAHDRRTDDVVRCRDGAPYGIGLVARRALFGAALTAVGGIYPVQDPGGGDLNLTDVPGGYRRADDGGVQNVLATAGFAVAGRVEIGMAATTDHPGLLVTLVPATPVR